MNDSAGALPSKSLQNFEAPRRARARPGATITGQRDVRARGSPPWLTDACQNHANQCMAGMPAASR
jgi:hypothetical protein